jgi:acyl-CoA dehydrogenase
MLTLLVIAAVFFLLTRQASLYIWTISTIIFSALLIRFGQPGIFTYLIISLVLMLFGLFLIRPLRQKLVTAKIFHVVKNKMPTMSSTEREALEAGTVSWEGDLFTGSPDFNILLNAPLVKLTAEEQAFMDGPVDVLCRMIDDWDITHNRADLPEEIWTFIKENRFLGMIISKQYGGLGFSATAQMSILVRIYGRSITAATTVSVPNSLGPAELLLKYGTTEQKDFYLPRLADGREIPCFALTAPNAGSDAASITDKGIVCYKDIDGKSVLGLSLTWNKRYITLCPVATVIGLAFKMFDPENILGKGKDLGITCALIPAETPGVIKGRRHYPLNAAFLNGPTQGKDVFVPLDYIIGGAEMAGQGWRMLMECLSAGRAISLPSGANGGVQLLAMVTGAYARIRKQFNQPISKFEGIEEPLARIAAKAYIVDAGLSMAAAAIDHGEKPSVAGAILKYHTTEIARQVVFDAMDIHGGKGICLGPNNYLGRGYQIAPIAITVEGANILTRSLIIFGQGAIRCHPYIFAELESARQNDLKAFDKAFFSHVGFTLTNIANSLVFAITDAYGTPTPDSLAKRYYQLIRRYSTNLAFLSDFSMLIMGGELKRKEKISARLGDMLSNLYLASAVLKRFHADGEPAEDLPLVEWSCQQLFHDCDLAMLGVITNFRGLGARILLRLCLKPLGNLRPKPSDELGQIVARILTIPSATRDRLTRLVFREALPNCPVGIVEAAFLQICAVEEIEKKLLELIKADALKGLTLVEQIQEAVKLGVLSEVEAEQLRAADVARQQVIAVDDFSSDQLGHKTVKKK